MAHFFGSFFYQSTPLDKEYMFQTICRSAEEKGWKFSSFIDKKFILVHSDFTTVRGRGYLEEQSTQAVTAIAGELVLAGDVDESFSKEVDIARISQSFRNNIPGLLSSSNGTFALCSYQGKNDLLVLATDSLGARPLYYCDIDGALIFSTSLNYLKKFPGVSKQPDFNGIAEQQAFDYPLGRRTLLNGVSVLCDGEYIVVSHGKWTLKKYNDWGAIQPVETTRELQLQKCHTFFLEALKSRASPINDVNISLLSGGLDSRCIVAGLKQLNKNVRAINCSKPGWQDYNYASKYADIEGIPLSHVPWTPSAVGLTAGQTTSGLLTHALQGQSNIAVFSGDGGGETLSFFDIHPSLISVLDNSGLDEFVSKFLISRLLPKRILVSKVFESICARQREAMLKEMKSLAHLPIHKALQLFFLRNELRRHLHDFFENIENLKVEVLLPFYDKRLLTSVIEIPAPLDNYIGHKFYHELLVLFPPAIQSVPWQTYPHHEICPISDGMNYGSQWKMMDKELNMISKRWRKQIFQALFSTTFARHILRRGPIFLVIIASMFVGARRYGHIFKTSLSLDGMFGKLE